MMAFGRSESVALRVPTVVPCTNIRQISSRQNDWSHCESVKIMTGGATSQQSLSGRQQNFANRRICLPELHQEYDDDVRHDPCILICPRSGMNVIRYLQEQNEYSRWRILSVFELKSLAPTLACLRSSQIASFNKGSGERMKNVKAFSEGRLRMMSL